MSYKLSKLCRTCRIVLIASPKCRLPVLVKRGKFNGHLNALIDIICFFKELQLPYYKLAATEIVSGVSGESEEKLRDLFTIAQVWAGINSLLDTDLYKSTDSLPLQGRKTDSRLLFRQFLDCFF